MLETIWQNVRHGTRMLAKNRGFALVAIMSVAIGVGANAAMFSVADGLVLRPLQVPRPGEIVTVSATTPSEGVRNPTVSYRDYVDVRDRAQSFSGLVAYRVVIASFADRRDELAQSTLGLAVSGNLFDVLAIQPALGRTFLPDEDRVAARAAVMVLAHDTWTQQFGSDPGILGRRLRLAGEEFTVIGVAPAGFPGMDLVLHPAFYVPLAMLPVLDIGFLSDPLERRDLRMLSVKGRLKPGVSVAAARQEVQLIASNPASVLWMVLRQALLPTTAGIAVGLVASVATRGLLRAAFPSIQGIDRVTYMLVVPALAIVVMFAGYIPARRAARIDPLAALRQD